MEGVTLDFAQRKAVWAKEHLSARRDYSFKNSL